MKFISSGAPKAYRYESNNYVDKRKTVTVICATDESHTSCQESQKWEFDRFKEVKRAPQVQESGH